MAGVLVLVVAGCSKGPPPAPGSNFVFTSQQASAAMATMRQAADESPRDPVVPLDLLPPGGVRWETLEAAVDHAVGVPELEMAVVGSKAVSETESVFYLVNPHMWPARVTVRHIDQPPHVAVSAVVGPWPQEPVSLRTAKVIEGRVLASIVQYGKVPVLPGYVVTSKKPGEGKPD